MDQEEDYIVYDVEEAAAEVARRTGQELLVVEEVLEAEFLFNAAMGFYEIPDDEEGQEFLEEVRRIRDEHADLVPNSEADVADFEEVEDRLVTFVHRLTGTDPAAVEKILDEHILYLEEKGILEPVAEDED